jgi:hypothetical protein
LYLHNPARGDAAARAGAWELLLSARAAAVSASADAAMSQGRFLSALRAAVVDGGVRLLAGRRVLCDFTLFAVAFVDSAADVDKELCALGALGAWHVLRSRPLRDFAAQHAAAAAAPGAGPEGEPQ